MTPTRPLPRRTHFSLSVATLAASVSLLAACGGGSGQPTAISADRLVYGQLSTFTASGDFISAITTFNAAGCDNLTPLPITSAIERQFSCVPRALSLMLAARAGDIEFYTRSVAVPKPQVTLTTSMGVVVVELEPAIVQQTVDNYLSYVNSGFYTGTIFHRVLAGFVDQGGSTTRNPDGSLLSKTGLGTAINLETNKGLSNLHGTIAMARTTAFNSAQAGFYINAVDNNGVAPNLNNLDYQSATSPGYAVFGKVVTGLAVVDAINAVPTSNAGVPVTDVVLQTAVQSR